MSTRTRLSDEERAEIERLLKERYSVCAVAIRTGRAELTIRRVREKLGLKPSTWVDPKYRSAVRRARESYQRGAKSAWEVAARYGVKTADISSGNPERSVVSSY